MCIRKLGRWRAVFELWPPRLEFELLSATPEVLKLRGLPRGSILLSRKGFRNVKTARRTHHHVFDRKEFRDQISSRQCRWVSCILYISADRTSVFIVVGRILPWPDFFLRTFSTLLLTQMTQVGLFANEREYKTQEARKKPRIVTDASRFTNVVTSGDCG